MTETFRVLMIRMTKSVEAFRMDKFYKVEDNKIYARNFLWNLQTKELSSLPVGSFKIWSIISNKDGTIVRVGQKIGARQVGIIGKKTSAYKSFLLYLNEPTNEYGTIIRNDFQVADSLRQSEYNKKVDIFANGDSIILRKGSYSSIYRIVSCNINMVCLENIITGYRWKQSTLITEFNNNPISEGVTKEEFKRFIPPKYDVDDFKPIDAIEIYNNCIDL